MNQKEETREQHAKRVINYVFSPAAKKRDRELMWAWMLGGFCTWGILGVFRLTTEWGLDRWLYIVLILLACVGLSYLYYEPLKRK